MQAIWKFPLTPNERQSVSMPKGTVIVSLQTQNDIPTMWGICNPDEEQAEREFLIVGTGHPFQLPYGCEFIGTYQTAPFVFHVFQLPIS